MASQEQIEANRTNSTLSTGPKDTSKTRLNATKFGIFSRELLLSLESSKELAEIRKDFLNEYDPSTSTEHLLVDKIITCIWRLKRLRKAENAIIQQRILEVDGEVEEYLESKYAEKFFPLFENKMGESIYQVPAIILRRWIKQFKEKGEPKTDEKGFEMLKFCEVLLEDRRHERYEFQTLARKKELMPSNIENLLAYETTLERQLFRSIEMLRKLKKMD